jgi:hypothetical protein
MAHGRPAFTLVDGFPGSYSPSLQSRHHRSLHRYKSDTQRETVTVILGDKGYQGSRYAMIPYKGKSKPESQKKANRTHAKLRAPGEKANAQLKTWRILRKLRCCPWKAGQLAKAIHVLQVREA